MAVGLVVLRDSIGKPDNAVHAEAALQLALDLGARHVRISIAVEEGSLGRDEQAVAVDRYRAALEDERHLVHGEAEAMGDRRADAGIGIVWRVLLAPGVEPEVHRVSLTVGGIDGAASAQSPLDPCVWPETRLIAPGVEGPKVVPK